jgi:hypothetical protein
LSKIQDTKLSQWDLGIVVILVLKTSIKMMNLQMLQSIGKTSSEELDFSHLHYTKKQWINNQ